MGPKLTQGLISVPCNYSNEPLREFATKTKSLENHPFTLMSRAKVCLFVQAEHYFLSYRELFRQHCKSFAKILAEIVKVSVL
jgi:hypothetical protein